MAALNGVGSPTIVYEIEDVKHLSPNLRRNMFADLEILKGRQIDLVSGRPVELVALLVPIGARGRSREHCRIEPVIGASGPIGGGHALEGIAGHVRPVRKSSRAAGIVPGI